MNQVPRLDPGENITPDKLRALCRAVEELQGLAVIGVRSPLQKQDGWIWAFQQPSTVDWFYARIEGVGYNDATGYEWHEVIPDGSGGWTMPAGYRHSEALDALTYAYSDVEGRLKLPTVTGKKVIVKLRSETTSGGTARWVFASGPGPKIYEFSIGSCGVRIDALGRITEAYTGGAWVKVKDMAPS